MPLQMNMFFAFILLPAGLLILIKGADFLVSGAVSLAERLGVSPLVIGLTIVAMGTSAPEVAASMTASLSGEGDMAIGNVYGSNIANLALVGGICAIIRPITVRLGVLKREMPVMIIVAALLFPVLHNMELSRIESFFLLVIFAGLILYTVISALHEGKANPDELAHANEHLHTKPKNSQTSVSRDILFIALGLIALTVGAKMTVSSAEFIGLKFGMSPKIIGLTIVAIGTSLPELITCLVAALKGHDDLSIGNLVGSNVFNTLLVVGAAGAIKPFTLKENALDSAYFVMLAVSIAFVAVAFVWKKINRIWGFIFASGYLTYLGCIAYRVATAPK